MSWKKVYGYLNESGEEVIPEIYNFISPFFKGIALVREGGRYNKKFGLINKKGEIIAQIIYDYIDGFYYYSNNIIKMMIGDKYGFLNFSGEEVIPAIYDDVSYLDEGFEVVLNDKRLILNKDGAIKKKDL